MAFQFHKGTIKTFIFHEESSGSVEFQFHKGTIKTRNLLQRQITLQVFQFHKGTIKTSQRSASMQSFQISIP